MTLISDDAHGSNLYLGKAHDYNYTLVIAPIPISHVSGYLCLSLCGYLSYYCSVMVFRFVRLKLLYDFRFLDSSVLIFHQCNVVFVIAMSPI